MSWKPDKRVLELIKLESPMTPLEALPSCPEPVASQAASLIYYDAEARYVTMRPAYTPPRLLEGNSVLNLLAFQACMPVVMEASNDIVGDLMVYHQQHDPEALRSLQKKCVAVLGACGLQEVPGIMAALRDSGSLPTR